MKSVLISIRPKWCALIASEKKTVEVRKNRPNIETPFKCYIYCTNDFADSRTRRKRSEFWIGEPLNNISKGRYNGNGNVIGEFVCDKIDMLFNDNGNPENYMRDILPEILKNTAMCLHEFGAYVGNRGKGKNIYGWHISDLKIYDKPKELREFKKMNRKCFYADLGLAKRDCPECQNSDCMITRPPQSWCYVEGLKNEI